MANANSEQMDDTTTTFFVLEEHTSLPAQSATDADGTDYTPPTLMEFIAAESKNEFFHNAARQPL